ADEMTKCYILASMSNVLQHQHQSMATAADMLLNLKELFGHQSRAARQEALSALLNTRMTEGTPVREHALKIMAQLNELEVLGGFIDGETQVDIMLQSLPQILQVSRQYLTAIFGNSSRDLCALVISQNIITCSIILNFSNVQMSPRREPDHPAPTQATVVAQFRDYHAEKFSGQGDPRIVDEWIQGLEFIFEVMDCPDRYRVICAQLQLTGDARLWWNAYWSMRPDEKARCTWDMLKELIREKYYPTYYRAEMERQFLSLQQGTRTVDEYEREFTRLAAFVPDLVRTEAQRAQHFIDGLYPAVRHNIVGHGTQTYARAVSIAQEVDASIRREAVRDHPQPSVPAQSSSVPPMPALPAAQSSKNSKRKGKGAPTEATADPT
ncbi:Unknown protein, partial [Striga hermonthica]